MLRRLKTALSIDLHKDECPSQTDQLIRLFSLVQLGTLEDEPYRASSLPQK
jgi:hypothetical protein